MTANQQYWQDYLAAGIRHGLSVDQLYALARLARTTYRYNTNRCNREMTVREDRADERRTAKARAIVESIGGLHLIEQGDPRGWPYIVADAPIDDGSHDLLRVPPFVK